MGYEINVALNGKHLFATHERSLQSTDKMKECLEIFIEKFPESEGYEITVSKWETTGKNIDISSILKK